MESPVRIFPVSMEAFGRTQAGSQDRRPRRDPFTTLLLLESGRHVSTTVHEVHRPVGAAGERCIRSLVASTSATWYSPASVTMNATAGLEVEGPVQGVELPRVSVRGGGLKPDAEVGAGHLHHTFDAGCWSERAACFPSSILRVLSQ